MGVADYSKRQLKNYKVPHFKSTDLNRIQVTYTLTCCNIQVKPVFFNLFCITDHFMK